MLDAFKGYTASDLRVDEASLKFIPLRKDTDISLRLKALANLFGQDLIIFRDASERPTGVLGATVPTINDVIFMEENREGYRPHLSVLGHEMLHSLRNGAPKLYNDFKKYLLSELKPDALQGYREDMDRRTGHDGTVGRMSDDKILEEIGADLVGKRLTEESFWAKMAEERPSLFARVAQFVRDLLDRVTAAFRADPLPTAWVKDFDAIRGHIDAMMGQWAEKNARAKTGGTPPHSGNTREVLDGRDETVRNAGRNGGEGSHFEDGLLQGERGGDGEPAHLVGDGGRGGDGGRAAQPTPEGREGGRSRQLVAIKIPNRAEEPAHYELLEADEVRASHLPSNGFQKNPAYGLENERRYHDEPGSRAKVMENAAKLDPAFLMESVDANHGAPIIDQDNNVLGGNGRAMSVARAYESFPERGKQYREALKANADRLGIDPAQVDAMRSPVLVRRLERGMSREERQQLVTAMNDDFKDAKEKRASGKTRGDRFGRRTLDMLSAGLKDAESLREYFDTPASAAVVERMMDDGVIQRSERNAYVGADGLLNPDGKKVVEEALRGRVARSYEALAKLPADVVGKLDAAIPHILVAESIGKPWDITEHVRASVDLLASFKSSGSKDADLYLKQVDMRTGRAPVQDYTKQAIALFRMALDAKKGEYVKAFEKYAGNAKMSPEAGGMPGVAKPQDRAFRESFRMEEEAIQSKPEKMEGKPQAKEASEGQPPEDAFGPAFPAFSGKQAIEHLMKVKEGHVPAAFHKEGLGDIDLPWGKEGKKGFGLAHIIERRNQSGMDGEGFAHSLPALIRDGRVETRPNYPGRAYIVSEKAETAVRLEWDGKRKNWIVTAYPLNKEAPGAVDGLRTSVHAFGDKQPFPLPHSGSVERNISSEKQAVNSEYSDSGDRRSVSPKKGDQEALPVKGKDEKAEKPRASLGDRTIVGAVTPDMASKLRLNKPGDIILDQEGIHHAERRHGKEIRSSGFADAQELISHVMANIDAIYQGNNNRTCDLVAKSRNPYARTIVRLEFLPEGDFYRVVTAGPSRPDAYNNKTPLWERAQSNRSLTGTPGAVSGQNGVSGREDSLKGRKVNVGKASLKKENVRASDSTPVAVVEVDPGIVPEFRKARDLAKWLKEYFADKREETILSTGKKVRFGNGNLEASIKRVREAAHNQAYAGLNELVRRAEYDSFEAKDERHPNLGGQEVYYSALRIGDSLYAVKFKMDVPSELELQTRRERRGEKNIEDLRYKDHALREIEIAPVLYRGVGPNTGGPTQATGAIREISLGVLRDAVKPSRLENGVLSSVKPGEFLNEVPPSRLRVHKAAVQSVADALGKRAANAADTRVVQSFEELPKAVRDVYGHVASQVEGVYDTETDTVYLVADNLRSPARVAEVWMHENMVHHGLSGLLEKGEKRRLLNRLWQGMGGMGNPEIAATARRYGVDPRSDAEGRALVMEEVLARLAEKRAADKLSGHDKTYWRRFVEAVLRAWHALVDAVTGRTGSMKYENADRLLAALDRYVFEGRPEGMAESGAVPAMASVDKPGMDREAAQSAWEQVQDDMREWGRQVDEFVVSKQTRPLLNVSRTPDVLRKLGAPDLPMTMTSRNLEKILSDKPDHGLPPFLVKQLPTALAQPVMVFESATSPDSFVVLTELKHQGRSIMAAVHLDTERQRVRVNDIASAYKRGSEAWYMRQIEEGRLLYQDKKKSLAWARTNRLQLPQVRKLPARLSGKRILTEEDVVKPIAPFQGTNPMASKRGDPNEVRFSPDTGKKTDFVTLPDGRVDFAQFPQTRLKDMRLLRGAPIRLQRGRHNPAGGNFGLLHIEAGHGEDIRNAGYENVQEFVWDLVNDFDQIWQGEGKSVLLVRRDKERGKAAGFINLEKTGEFYSVNTAFPADAGYPQQKTRKLLWSRDQHATPATGEQAPFNPFRAFRNPIHSQTGNLQGQRGQSDKNIQQGRTEGKPLASLRDREDGDAAPTTPLDSFRSKIGGHRPTVAERFAVFRENWKRKVEQQIFDHFASIKDVSKDGYVQARMTSSLGTQIESLIKYGAPVWNDGIMGVQGKSLTDVFAPVASEMDSFMGWMVANRAARLKKEGRENLFTDAEIAAARKLNEGVMPDGSRRADAYKKVFEDFARFKKAVLDFAQEGGIIDPESRSAWENADYIPFYRVKDGLDTVRAARNNSGLAGQASGIRTLKGGKANIGDPVENIMQNFIHLIDAAQKNRAADMILQDMAKARLARKLAPEEVARLEKRQGDELAEVLAQDKELAAQCGPLTDRQRKVIAATFSPTEFNYVRVQKDGKSLYYSVEDPMLLDALTGMWKQDGRKGPVWNLLRGARRFLTTGVTTMPDFMLRNFLRDTLHTWTIEHQSGYRPLVDSLAQIRNTFNVDEDTKQLLAVGSAFMGSGYRLGNSGEEAAKALNKVLGKYGMDKKAFLDSVLDSEGKLKSFIGKLWDTYEHAGSAAENAARLAVYKKMRAKGFSHREAAFAAKDMMDFTVRGQSQLIQSLCETVPFLGARLAGLHRLGRGAVENPRAFAVKGMTIALASMALYALNQALNPDDWDKMEDWEKDTYFHFWVDGEHFRLPKPFEVGFVFGTIPERLMEQLITDKSGGVFASRVFAGIWDQLAFNPFPQAVRPLVEQVANKDFFRGTPIVGMGMDRKAPVDQFDSRTSLTARAMASFMDALLTPVMGKTGADVLRSPKRLEHLVNGYFGGLGAFALGASDMLLRPLGNEPEAPELKLEELPIIRSFYSGSGEKRTRYESELYEVMKQGNKLHASLKQVVEEGGDVSAAKAELSHDDIVALANRKGLTALTKEFGKLNKAAEKVRINRVMSSSDKRKELDNIQRRKNILAQRAMKRIEEMRVQ